MYLTDALGAVVQNINAVASTFDIYMYNMLYYNRSLENLEDLVGLQVEAVESLTTQMTLIKTYVLCL